MALHSCYSFSRFALVCRWHWCWYCSLGVLLGSGRSGRPQWYLWLILFHEIPWENTLVLPANRIDILAGVPIIILLFCYVYDLTLREIEVVVVGR